MNEEGINIGLPNVFQEASESRLWAGISIQAKRLIGQLRTRGIHEITFTPHLKSLISPILFAGYNYVTSSVLTNNCLSHNSARICNFSSFPLKLLILTVVLHKLPFAHR